MTFYSTLYRCVFLTVVEVKAIDLKAFNICSINEAGSKMKEHVLLCIQ